MASTTIPNLPKCRICISLEGDIAVISSTPSTDNLQVIQDGNGMVIWLHQSYVGVGQPITGVAQSLPLCEV